MPKRPNEEEELENGWVALTDYTPTIYRKELKLRGGWGIRVLQVRRASELYYPLLCLGGRRVEPCPARLALPALTGEWMKKQDCLKLLQEMRRYVAQN